MLDVFIQHDFPGMNPDQWFEIYLDDGFNEELEKRLDVKTRKVLQSDRDGDIVKRRVKLEPNIPSMLKKFVKDGMSVEEQSTVYLDRHHVDWTTHTSLGGDKFNSSGTLAVTAQGDGCSRILRGTVEVRIPLMGKKIEKKIVETIKESYEIATRLMKEWHKR